MEAQETDDLGVIVTVVRSGGFAGLRRQWTAEPSEADAPRWIALIDGCPWNEVMDPAEAGAGSAAGAGSRPGAPGKTPSGVRSTAGDADRFTWRIDAHCGGESRRAELQETRLNGPWRDLVDEVQTFEQEREGRGYD